MAAPDYGPFFQASGQMHDIDPLLLQAISMHEDASGDPNAIGPANKTGERAIGVMQFLPSTAATYGVDPNDPGSAILGAGAYLAKLRADTNDNLPAMLAQYGGRNATGYASSVINTYHQLQKSWGVTPPLADDRGDASSAAPPVTSSGDQGGIKITARALPSTFNPNADVAGHNASFTPPPSTPGNWGVSNAPGSRTSHPMQASEYGSTSAPADFTTQLFGPEPAKQTPAASPAPAPSDQPVFHTPASDADQARVDQVMGNTQAGAPEPTAPPADFTTQLFGPTGTAAGVTPQPDRAADARASMPPSDVTIPSATAAPTPPQPSWWQSNVADPVGAMYNPTQGAPMNYLLGQPLLQNIGAGVLQGPRNVAQRANEWEQAADQAYPTLAAIDRSVGETPDVLAARGRQLAAQTQAYRTQYGNSLPAAGGELAGNLLTTYPLAAIGAGLGAVGSALPLLRGATEVATAGGVPAAQNILTTPGQDWRTAGAQGATGGLAVHGVLGSVAGQFARGAVPQAVQEARDLGFDLTTGEERGGLAKQIEDVNQYLPGSGAAQKAAGHRAQVNTILNRNMGMPESPVLNQATMQTARAHAKNLMDQIDKVTVDANKDPNLLTELGDIHAAAAAQPMTGTSITGAVDKVLGSIDQNGKLSGSALHDLIKTNTPLDDLVNSPDPVIKRFAGQIKTSLLDAVSRSDDPAIYNPADVAANRQAVNDFNQGRYNYKVIKTVEPLVDKTGSLDDQTYGALARRIQGTVANPNFDPRFTSGNTEMQKLGRVLDPNGPLAALKSSGTGRQMITGTALGLLGEGGAGAGLAQIVHPQGFANYLTTVAMPTLASIGAGRISRYGPGLGIPAVQAARIEFNPLLPRVAGPAVGANPLLTQPPQQGQ